MSLFDEQQSGPSAEPRPDAPLAARMRPRTLEEFVGQRHFVGPGQLLWRMIRADRLASLVFYGPPGTGKTALAHVIARHTQARFEQVNAVTSNVAEIRDLDQRELARERNRLRFPREAKNEHSGNHRKKRRTRRCQLIQIRRL